MQKRREREALLGLWHVQVAGRWHLAKAASLLTWQLLKLVPDIRPPSKTPDAP